MSTLLFDTHAYVKNLTSAGFSERQAEVLAEEQANLIENKLATKQDFEKLQTATKQDFQKLQTATKQDFEKFQTATKQDIHSLDQKIDRLEKNVKRDIKESEMRMTIKLGALMVVALSILTTIFTTIFKFTH